MCNELLLLPNKKPTKTPNREMSVVSCFLCFSWNFDTAYTRPTKFDFTEKFNETIHSLNIRKCFCCGLKLVIFFIKRYKLKLQTACMQYYAFIFGLDSKMVMKIQWKYTQMDLLQNYLVTQIRWNKVTRYSTDKHVQTI